MPDPAADERVAEAFRRRGYLLEWHIFFADELPDVLDAYEQMRSAAQISDGLPSRYRECVYAAVLSSRGEDDLARNHMHKALDAGATRRELLDAILVAWNSTGAITLYHGVRTLTEVLIDRGEYQPRAVPFPVTDRDEPPPAGGDGAPPGSARA